MRATGVTAEVGRLAGVLLPEAMTEAGTDPAAAAAAAEGLGMLLAEAGGRDTKKRN